MRPERTGVEMARSERFELPPLELLNVWLVANNGFAVCLRCRGNETPRRDHLAPPFRGRVTFPGLQADARRSIRPYKRRLPSSATSTISSWWWSFRSWPFRWFCCCGAPQPLAKTIMRWWWN